MFRLGKNWMLSRLVQSFRIRRWLLLAVLLLVVGCGVGSFVLLCSSAAARDLAAARARWQARPFGAYRLTLTLYEPAPPGGCRQELIIHDEQVVEVIADGCTRFKDPMTVRNLFTIIEPDPQYTTMRTALDPCNVGAECVRVKKIQATYHPQLGYPQTMVVRYRLQANWQHLDNWTHLFRHGRFPSYEPLLGSPFDQHIVVEALQPLQ